MEQEIIKHSRKIFGVMKEKRGSFWEKAREIVIEIFIIVFAVTFSIWLHSIKEHSKEQKEVRVFLSNIREDLDKDLIWLKADRDSYYRMSEILKKVINLTPAQIDSMKKIDDAVAFPFQTIMDKVNNGNYEGFKSSGKIGYIENETLKKAILNYYQQDAPTILEINDFINQYMLATLDIRAEYADRSNLEALLSPKVQLRFAFLQFLGTNILQEFDSKAIPHAEQLIKMINNELGD